MQENKTDALCTTLAFSQVTNKNYLSDYGSVVTIEYPLITTFIACLC